MWKSQLARAAFNIWAALEGSIAAISCTLGWVFSQILVVVTNLRIVFRWFYHVSTKPTQESTEYVERLANHCLYDPISSHFHTNSYLVIYLCAAIWGPQKIVHPSYCGEPDKLSAGLPEMDSKKKRAQKGFVCGIRFTKIHQSTMGIEAIWCPAFMISAAPFLECPPDYAWTVSCTIK